MSPVDPDGLLEYSVVYTDRSLNHMSKKFQHCFINVLNHLKSVYKAHTAIVVPGSGTFGMEATARQFIQKQKCMVVRNGWFSYRWTQIIEMGNLTDNAIVHKAKFASQDKQAPLSPAPIDEVVTSILAEKPTLVFAPHVETSAGLMLTQDYIKKIADAVRQVGGLFILDCIAAGTIWLDMQEMGIDVLISAPQKSWSCMPCCGLVMLSEKAQKRMQHTQSDSFSADLKQWYQIAQTYENGGHAYHATMPTDGLAQLSNTMDNMAQLGFDKLQQQQVELGQQLHRVLDEFQIKRVAHPDFRASGVIVCYTDDADIKSGSRFLQQGVQIAAGVPLKCDELEDYQSFRIGLFGLDKLLHIDRTVSTFKDVLQRIF